LEFVAGESAESLGLTGHEQYEVLGIKDELEPGGLLRVQALSGDGTATGFQAKVRIDTPIELDYYRNGGILHMMLRQMA
jgi:aconitate hydratase